MDKPRHVLDATMLCCTCNTQMIQTRKDQKLEYTHTYKIFIKSIKKSFRKTDLFELQYLKIL